ncbi:MAG TPA: hypothetical protein VKV74_18205 [Bryobacteraceae bacterium]|nr:hypothetical protein [Bryobacteraceae bacterium]
MEAPDAYEIRVLDAAGAKNQKMKQGVCDSLAVSAADCNLLFQVAVSTNAQLQALDQQAKAIPGHDRRYALTSAKLMRETGWKGEMPFEKGLQATLDWYRSNPGWVARVKSGEYQQFYERNYQGRAV